MGSDTFENDPLTATTLPAGPCASAFDEWAKGRYLLDTEDGLVAYARAFQIWLAAWEARGDSQPELNIQV